jgi:hypothetical protein
MLGLARRNLDTILATLLEASAEEKAREPKKEWVEALEQLSATSCEIYRNLVYKDDDFLSFFSGASPIGELSLVNIGSRPAKRVEKPDVESLRAIPWVFAWTQNRFLLFLLVRRRHRALLVHRGERQGARTPEEDVPRVAVLPNARRLHADGAGEERPAYRRSLLDAGG